MPSFGSISIKCNLREKKDYIDTSFPATKPNTLKDKMLQITAKHAEKKEKKIL